MSEISKLSRESFTRGPLPSRSPSPFPTYTIAPPGSKNGFQSMTNPLRLPSNSTASTATKSFALPKKAPALSNRVQQRHGILHRLINHQATSKQDGYARILCRIG